MDLELANENSRKINENLERIINMKITKKQIIYLKEISSPFYDEIKVEFLFHSNKLEGSTFDEEQLITLLTENKVQGNIV